MSDQDIHSRSQWHEVANIFAENKVARVFGCCGQTLMGHSGK